MNRKKGHRDYNGKNSGDRVATFSTASMTSLGRSRWSCNGINNEDRGATRIDSQYLLYFLTLYHLQQKIVKHKVLTLGANS